MSEIVLPQGGWRLPGRLPGIFFTCFPASIEPPEGIAAGIVGGDRRVGAVRRDGVWVAAGGKAISWEPTHWLVLETGKQQ